MIARGTGGGVRDSSPVSALRRTGEVLLKVLSFFLILEPVWMLLPFAGFLYGSVFQIQSLSRNPLTAPLTHFVFPVLTLGPLGPILAASGLILFAVGAVQIYGAKLRRTGLVTSGLYRFVRHPQYISLTLFGLGILLTWGRAVAYVAFSAMMLLYYWLAKIEEDRCRAAFGEDYESYRDRTSFLFPGDHHIPRLLSGLRLARWPTSTRVALGLVFAAAACIGSMAAIDAVKRSVRTIPFLVSEVALPSSGRTTPEVVSSERSGVPFVSIGRVAVVRGPWRNAAAPGFAEAVLLRLERSAALAEFLSFLHEPGGDSVIAFGLPLVKPEVPGEQDDGRRGPPSDPGGPDRARLMLLRVTLTPGSAFGDAIADPARRTIRGAAIAPIHVGSPADRDLVEGDVLRPGPRFPAEERWTFLLDQVATMRANSGLATPPAAVPGRHATVSLVLVKAPILRTRVDPEFADEILDRLASSETLRRHLAKTGAGGDIIPVAFPRPGANWYREHHGTPDLSVFVMLVHRRDAGDRIEDLLHSDRRSLVGAFTAEMSFGIARPDDSVTGITVIGPRRDLEERWAFFLSGL